MNEKIEEVARALCREAGIDPDGSDEWAIPGKLKNWETRIGGARAAILAMREPTHMAWPESMSQYWRAAIDEALK